MPRLFALLVLLLPAALLLPGSPAMPASPADDEGQIVPCSSDDMQFRHCAADTREGVQLMKQRSEAGCIPGRTWGYDHKGVWVDKGCRADFRLGGIYCASDDMRRHRCPADTRGGVRLLRQRSEADCVKGRTWGYDDDGIWVDRGCRAEFRVGRRRRHDDDNGPGGTLYCASDDMRRHTCSADTRGGVRLLRQRSDANCIEGRTWGYDQDGIWVDRGCRAEFELLDDDDRGRDRDRDRDRREGESFTLYCASDNMRRNECPADTRGGVRMIRQRSEASCIEGRTWGYDRKRIWVDRGCRADFEVGGR